MVKGLRLDQKAWTKKHGKKITKEFSGMGSITNLKENKTIFVPCDCGNEILAIEYDHKVNAANIALYENKISYLKKMSFWQKILYCYGVMVGKKPYADQICLRKKQLKDLLSFLQHLEL